MAEGELEPRYARGPIPVAALVRLSLALVRDGWRRAAPAWLAFCAVNLAVTAVNFHLHGPERTWTSVLELLSSLVQQLLLLTPAAAGLRALLGARQIWAFDKPLRDYAARTMAMGAAALVSAWASDAIFAMVRTGALPALVLFAWLAVLIVLVVAYARLGLWAVGRLMGDARMTAGRSWRQTKGVMLSGGIAGVLLLFGALIAPFAVYVTVVMWTGAKGTLIASLGRTLVAQPGSVAIAALTAAIWRLRNGRGEGVAAVFD